MAEITAELAMEVTRFRSALQRANGMLDSFVKKGAAKGKGLGTGLAKGFKAAFLPALAAIGLAGGIAGIGTMIVKNISEAMKQAAHAERIELSFGTLLNDPAAGTELFNQLREFSRNYGAEVGAMSDQLRRLIGMGMDTESAIKLQKSLLDVSGMLGLTGEQTRLLASALVQVKAKGVSSMEELRQQIAEKGIPIFEALMEKVGLTGKAFFDAVAQGKIGADETLGIFIDLEGQFAKFRGGAEKMAQTTGGAWAVMKANIADMRLEFGKPIADAVRPIIRDATEMIAGFKSQVRSAGEAIANTINFVRAMIQEFSGGEIMGLLADGLKLAFAEGVNHLASGIFKVLEVLNTEEIWVNMQDNMIASAKAFLAVMGDGVADIFGFTHLTYVQNEEKFDDKGNLIPGSGGMRQATPGEIAEMRRQQFLREGGVEPLDLGGMFEKLKNAMINGSDAIDTDELKAQLQEKMNQINARSIVNQMEEKDIQTKIRAATPEEEKTIPTRRGFTLKDQSGVGLQGAVDAFFGRSAFGEKLDESNLILNRIDKTLTIIAGKEIPKVAGAGEHIEVYRDF